MFCPSSSSPAAPSPPQAPAGKAQGAAACGGGKGKGTTGDAKLNFGHGTSRALLPVHELQVFLLEAAVLLAVSGRVLLQLRHPLLQKDNLCDGRGEDQPPVLKPAGKAALSAGATPTTSAAPCGWLLGGFGAASASRTDSEPVTPTQLPA